MNPENFDVVTVTLNPAIDRTVTISHFTAGIVNRVENVRSNPGGKGVNVAAALADAGHRVAVTGFLGRENTASFEALFARKKIADHFVRIAGPTRDAIKIVDPELHQTTDINYPGLEPSAFGIDALMQQLGALDARCFVLAGSLPPGVEPAIYQRLIGTLKSRGARVVLDASGEALRLGLAAGPHLFKPNIHELGELLGSTPANDREVVAAAQKLIASGIEQVVVSMGKAGACFVTADEAVIARPPEVEVRSTVGAGDAMVAGIVSAQLRGLSLTECARLATAFSIQALTRTGDDADLTQAIAAVAPRVRVAGLGSTFAASFG
jgi:1-phosphofructokinase